MVEILVSARKALKPTSDSRLQDFLGTLQSFEAYLRFQPVLIFPLAASRQLRRALTIRYRDSSVDSNIPETSLWHGLMVWSRSWFRWSSPPSMTKYQEARKALEPTSYPRLQDFLDTLQSFEAYLRFQATGFSGYVAKL